MRILILGKTGQIARELARTHWPTNCSLVQLGRTECDIADADAVFRSIRAVGPDVVVNAAAYTAVDRAESESELAWRLNRDAPGILAEACHKWDAALIHLSTDYVFDGKKPSAYLEADPVAPLSVYGRSKAEGEAAIRAVIRRHVILRTSWVFSPFGSNFVLTVLRLSREPAELRVVDDQCGAPTSARSIAAAIARISNQVAPGDCAWGTFHFTSAEPVTWFGFAKAILEGAGRSNPIAPISTHEYGASALRPFNSVLDCQRIKKTYDIDQPSWRTELAQTLAELLST